MSEFAKNLILLRNSKNLSQEDVAKYLELSRPAYTRYENEQAEPTIERLSVLADLYNVSLDEL